MDNSRLSLTTNNDLFTDELSVPDETLIYYSKKVAVIWLVISVINLVGVIYAAFNGESYLAVIIIGPVFSYVLFSSIKSLTNKRPQIILNANGVQSGKFPFYFWNEIKNEEVVAKTRRGSIYFLKYYSPSGLNEINLDVLAIDHRKLEKLLTIYRGRNNYKVS